MSIVFLIFAFAFFILWEVPALLKRRYWKEIIVFGVLLVLAFGLASVTALGIRLPAPTVIMTRIVKSLFGGLIPDI